MWDWGNLDISRSSIELGISMLATFLPFVTSTNVQRTRTCYFDRFNIFLIKKFCSSLTVKILKEGKKKNFIQNFHKDFVTFIFSCFTLIDSLYKTRHNIYKNIFFIYFWMSSFVFKLLKKSTKKKYTKTCCEARQDCFAVSKYTHF